MRQTMTCQREVENRFQGGRRPLPASGSSQKFGRTNRKQMEAKMQQMHDQLPGRSKEDRFEDSDPKRPSASHSWLTGELAKMQPRPYRHWSDAGRWVDLSPRVESELYGNRPRHLDSAAVRTGLSLHRRYPELPAGCERNETDNICQESCLFSSITPLAEINWEWLWLRSTT